MSRGGEITVMRLKIAGRVQGVGFRQFAIGEARVLGLKGWVRNCADGTVEAVASGPTKAIEAFVAACARGPAAARVTHIDLSPAEPHAEVDFVFKPTM